jgi:cysteinyl-tRNA synthetase
MLRTHYRQPLDWTLVGLDEAHKTLWEWYGDLEGKAPSDGGVSGPVLDALLDDLNTPKAIAELHKLHSAGHWGALRTALEFLGFSADRSKIQRVRHVRVGDELRVAVDDKAVAKVNAEAVGERIEARNAARKAKNFAEADRIRGELEAMGVTLKDAKDPKTGEFVTTWEVAR